MTTPIIEHKIDIAKATEVYNRICDAIQVTDAKRGEAIVAILTFLGYQFAGEDITPEEMTSYIDDIVGWLNLRFMETGETQ